MVPFAAPPVTLQVTAVFEVPVTTAVNCAVFATATLTLAGVTETATDVFCEVPAQPDNKAQAQLRPLNSKAERMKVLTGGLVSNGMNRTQTTDSTESIYPWDWTTKLAKKMLPG
jgi:hypothetical protein